MINLLSLREGVVDEAIQCQKHHSGLLPPAFAGVAMTICVLMLTGCLGKQNPQQASVVTYGTSNPAGSTGMHTVLDGDTVYSVSKRYNLPIRDIITVNKLSAPYVLNVGYRMKLPPPNEYRVRDGDNLSAVAQMFDSSMFEIARLNDLQAPYVLRAGQVLRLPSVSNKAPSPSTSRKAFGTSLPSPRGGESSSALAVPGEGGMITPNQKPAVQKTATQTRAKIPNKTPPRSVNGRFMQPVDGQVISGYGPKKGGLYNDGINIRAARGTPVRAAENGVIVYAGNEIDGFGNLILVRHADRYMTAYAHMDKMLVSRGATVKAGQSIGTVGSTGSVNTPQLHFEIRRGSKAVDPQRYL